MIGRDCNICDHAYVEGGAVLGDRVTVKNGVLVWYGVTVGDDVFLGPGMVFTNDLVPRSRTLQGERDWMVPTSVGNGVSLGANVTVVCGIEVGAYAFAGAGSGAGARRAAARTHGGQSGPPDRLGLRVRHAAARRPRLYALRPSLRTRRNPPSYEKSIAVKARKSSTSFAKRR